MQTKNVTLKSAADLAQLQDDLAKQLQHKKNRIFVCTGGGCIASGSIKVIDALSSELKNRSLQDKFEIVETGCLGPCAVGPVMLIGDDDIFYQYVQAQDSAEIIDKHLLGGEVIDRLLHPVDNTKVTKRADLPFFKNQNKKVLNLCGQIDPKKMTDYIAFGGYQAISKALTSMSSDQVIQEVIDSKLRGRGGAGFLTGLKWSFAKKYENKEKYMLCNADEGDPGAFMDRSILEGDPHSVIEGMLLGAYAIGSQQGYVYVRAEYPLACERLQLAIDQARDMGLLGKNILGSGFNFDLEIRKGSGAFVCGEETALMASIEGFRGEPRPRPPYPAEKGLWQKPSVLNNVETLASIAAIINHGGKTFAQTGTEKSAGTKIFALAGTINISGLVEVAIGTPLRKLIFDIGGGISTNRPFKAAQIGGPSGGCIPAEHLDVPLDYETLNELGAIMGSGGLIVMDDTSCMVDVAKFFLEFVQDESCGKCVPCREGTARMLEILERITEGKGVPEDIEKLEKLAVTVKNASLCGLGQTAANPVLSTLQHFREEYHAHIHDKKCPTASCKKLIVYEITDNCTGCVACKVACPVSAITGDKKQKHLIHNDVCTRCGLCMSTCKFNAIIKY